MFFTVNDTLREMYPYLVKFILDKHQKGLPPGINIYCYFNSEGKPRYNPYSIVGHVGTNEIQHLTEVTYPPFGFVMTFQNSKMPDSRMVDITHYSAFSYETEFHIDMKLHSLETWLPFAGDYRSKEEIQNAIANAKKE